MENKELALQLTLKSIEKLSSFNSVEEAKTIPVEIYKAILNGLNEIPIYG